MLVSLRRWNGWNWGSTNRCEESPRRYCQTGKLLDVDRTNPVDHFTQADFTRWDETVLVLFGDATLVAGEYDEIAFGLADQEHIFINGSNGRGPDSLIMSTNFFQFVVGTVLSLGILDDANALHQIGNHD